MMSLMIFFTFLCLNWNMFFNKIIASIHVFKSIHFFFLAAAYFFGNGACAGLSWDYLILVGIAYLTAGTPSALMGFSSNYRTPSLIYYDRIPLFYSFVIPNIAPAATVALEFFFYYIFLMNSAWIYGFSLSGKKASLIGFFSTYLSCSS